MESHSQKFYRLVQVKGGHSASYMNNNMTKSDNYIAIVKNGSLKSRIVIYKI